MIALVASSLPAQTTLDTVLQQIERNNPLLQALKLEADARMLEHQTGLMPANPEATVNYLWGNPSALGNRTDINITQSFEFPTVYFHKARLSELQMQRVETEYGLWASVLLYEARLICLELVYQNALMTALRGRQEHARQIVEFMKRKFDLGEVTVLDYRKSEMNLLNITGELRQLEAKQAILDARLQEMNGGNPLAIRDTVLGPVMLDTDFERWFIQITEDQPVLQWNRLLTEIANREIRLASSQRLPGIHGGYMSEKILGQEFRGFIAGITIPLWEQRNTVNHAKAKAVAAKSREETSLLQYRLRQQSLHEQALHLQQVASMFQNDLADLSNIELLDKAFQKGEITITEYLLELSAYYQSSVQLFHLQYEAHLLAAELYNPFPEQTTQRSP